MWDSGTGVEQRAFRFDVPQINAVAFSPDGKRLAAGGGDANSAKAAVWQLTGE